MDEDLKVFAGTDNDIKRLLCIQENVEHHDAIPVDIRDLSHQQSELSRRSHTLGQGDRPVPDNFNK